ARLAKAVSIPRRFPAAAGSTGASVLNAKQPVPAKASTRRMSRGTWGNRMRDIGWRYATTSASRPRGDVCRHLHDHEGYILPDPGRQVAQAAEIAVAMVSKLTGITT